MQGGTCLGIAEGLPYLEMSSLLYTWCQMVNQKMWISGISRDIKVIIGMSIIYDLSMVLYIHYLKIPSYFSF